MVQGVYKRQCARGGRGASVLGAGGFYSAQFVLSVCLYAGVVGKDGGRGMWDSALELVREADACIK